VRPSKIAVPYAKWIGHTPRGWPGRAPPPGGVQRKFATRRSVMQRHRDVSPCGGAPFLGKGYATAFMKRSTKSSLSARQENCGFE